ncbi:hypothetical protein ACFQX6_18080 [Streptosporangium lutulentum]
MLRRPDLDDQPTFDVLMVNAGEDLELAETAWHAYNDGAELPDASRTVRIIDLLDEEVALTPAHRVSGLSQSKPSAFIEARKHAMAALARLDIPTLTPSARRRELPMTSVGELARAGVVTVHQGPLKMATEEGSPRPDSQRPYARPFSQRIHRGRTGAGRHRIRRRRRSAHSSR